MFGVGDEAVEPVAEDFSVGVEQDDGAALAQAEGAVDRADEAEVRSFSTRWNRPRPARAASSAVSSGSGERSLTASRVKGVAWGADRQAWMARRVSPRPL